METVTQSPVKNGLIYGLITGVAMIIIMLLLHLANLYMTPGLQYLIYIGTIVGMYLGIVNYRDKILNGYITYGGAFYSGFLIGLFSTILYVIFFFIYIKFINPGMIDDMMTMARQKLEEKAGDLSEDQMDMAMSMQAKFMSPPMLALFGLIGNLIFSTIIALILAIVTKKQDNSMPPVIS